MELVPNLGRHPLKDLSPHFEPEQPRVLSSFLAVVQHGSFTRAAEHLFLTQSAVSHQVAAMESDVGVELLTRSRKAVEPTVVGKTLAEEARRLLDDANPLVRGAAVWALGQLVSRKELEALKATASASEHDESVREEWQAAFRPSS